MALLSLPSHTVSLWRTFSDNRSLILQLARREILGRYTGSQLGVLWSLIQPLIMLAVYTFVFSVVFQARWERPTASRSEFAMVLFCGLIVFNLFAECLNRAPCLILQHSTYVKKVVFPLEILPWVALCSSLFHLAMSFVVLLCLHTLLTAELHWQILLFPVVLIPLTLLILGLSWFLASLGVFVRDVGQVIGILTTILLFLSPIFYPLSAVPERFRPILYLNPVSFIVEQTRRVVLWGRNPDVVGLGLYLLAALAVAWLGLFWFQKTRKGFSDVI